MFAMVWWEQAKSLILSSSPKFLEVAILARHPKDLGYKISGHYDPNT